MVLWLFCSFLFLLILLGVFLLLFSLGMISLLLLWECAFWNLLGYRDAIFNIRSVIAVGTGVPEVRMLFVQWGMDILSKMALCDVIIESTGYILEFTRIHRCSDNRYYLWKL
jgi:hypothetical protein